MQNGVAEYYLWLKNHQTLNSVENLIITPAWLHAIYRRGDKWQ